jgi:LacI family transcriptional regulator
VQEAVVSAASTASTGSTDEGGVELELHPVGSLDEETGARVVGEYLTKRLPDAFVCANDELALGLLGRLRQAGVAVPHDVKVTGWDDVMAARYAGLTTVRQPMRDLGGTAARLLDELIVGTRTAPRHELLPTELVVRTSTSP